MKARVGAEAFACAEHGDQGKRCDNAVSDQLRPEFEQRILSLPDAAPPGLAVISFQTARYPSLATASRQRATRDYRIATGRTVTPWPPSPRYLKESEPPLHRRSSSTIGREK